MALFVLTGHHAFKEDTTGRTGVSTLLFYKTGNLTMAFMVGGLVLINQLSGVTINGYAIGSDWMPLSIDFMLLAHGAAGTIIFKAQ